MRPAPTAARPAASAVASASGAAPLITATLDTAMLPDGLQDMITSVAKKVDPRYRSVTFNRVLNQDDDGHRRFGFYVHVGAPWNCMVCSRTHDANNFSLQWSERTKTISLFCIRASGEKKVHPVAELERWAPRQTTHYDNLGIDATASADDIIGAAAVPPAGVTPQQVQTAVRVLTSPGRRRAYDQQTQAGDPDGSDSDDEGVTDGALTLADVLAENPALHEFVVSVYGQYLPSVEPEQVVGTVRLISVAEATDGEDEQQSRQFSIKLRTAGTDYVCAFAQKKHSRDGAALVYTCKDADGCCNLTLVCDRQHRCASHDKCVLPAAARSNLTERMMMHHVCKQLGMQFVFLTAQGGFSVAVLHPELGWTAWQPNHHRGLIELHKGVSVPDGFSPFKIGRSVIGEVDFAQAFAMMQSSPYRQTAKRLVYAPDGKLKEGELNTFKRLAITRDDAIAYAQESGVLDAEDVQDGALTATGFQKAEEAIAPWLEHSHRIIADGVDEKNDYNLNYFAHLVQKPGEKPCTAEVFQSSGKGAGKGAWMTPILAILGTEAPFDNAIQIDDLSRVVGRFNGVRAGKLLIWADEAVFTGDPQQVARLKSLISELFVCIEQKGKEQFPLRCALRLVITTNDDKSAPVISGERRYNVNQVSNELAATTDGTSPHKQYFDALWAVKPELIALYLYHRNISDFDPRDIPLGAAEATQAALHLSVVQQFWKEAIDTEVLVSQVRRHTTNETVGEYDRPVSRDQRRTWRFGGAPVPRALVYEAFRARRGTQYTSDSAFWIETNRILAGCAPEVRKAEGYAGVAGRPRCADFASLSACRAAFKKESGVDAGGSSGADVPVAAGVPAWETVV
jgi:hypothetical protein